MTEAVPLPCASKASYPQRKRAAQAASVLRKRLERAGRGHEPIQFYHCEYCSQYHLGHPVGWRRKTGNPRPQIRTTL